MCFTLEWPFYFIVFFCISFDSCLWKDNLQVTSSLCSVTHMAHRVTILHKTLLPSPLLLECLHGALLVRGLKPNSPTSTSLPPQPLVCPHGWSLSVLLCEFPGQPCEPWNLQPVLLLLCLFLSSFPDQNVFSHFLQLSSSLLKFRIYSFPKRLSLRWCWLCPLSPIVLLLVLTPSLLSVGAAPLVVRSAFGSNLHYDIDLCSSLLLENAHRLPYLMFAVILIG